MKRRTSNRTILLVMLSIIIGLLVWGFARGLERYDQVVLFGPSNEAQTDPYLALKRWLESQGVTHRSYRRFANPEDLYGYTAAIMDVPTYAGIGGYPVVTQWILGGGDLVLIWRPEDITKLNSVKQALLNEFGAHGFSVRASADGEAGFPLQTTIQFNANTEYVVHVDRSIRFFADGRDIERVASAEGEGFHVGSVRMGQGTITFFGRPWFMENDYIGEIDNGAFIWNHVIESAPEPVVLLAVNGRLGSGSEARRYMYLALVFLALLIALLIWRLSAPSGTRFELNESSGADISRRLLAEGVFLWKYSKSASVIRTCQADTARIFRQRGYTLGTGETDFERVSSETGIAAAEIREVMDPRFAPTWANQTKEAVAIFKRLKDEL